MANLLYGKQLANALGKAPEAFQPGYRPNHRRWHQIGKPARLKGTNLKTTQKHALQRL